MRIVVVGARGQLGGALVQEFSNAGHQVLEFDRSKVDLLDSAAVTAELGRHRPDAIVNAAAYNAVDAAEDHPREALEANAMAVRSLARAARAFEAALVHYSTDFVFDGTADAPYEETQAPNPRSVYGTSKMIGEWFAADAPLSYVLRVESLFGSVPGGPVKGTVAGIIGAIRKGEDARVFVDRTVSPTYVFDAARATRLMLERGTPGGIYHCVNTGYCTWFEFAVEAARRLGVVSPRLQAVKVADVPLRAARPQYCALSNAKLVAAGIPMRAWRDALADYVNSAL